jgi:hypothetical protein
METAAKTAKVTGGLLIRFFDGTRQLVPEGTRVQLTVFDGWQHKVVSKSFTQSAVTLGALEIQDNSGDDYRILASARGHRDTGFFPVRVSAGVLMPVDLMLLPTQSNVNLGRATWKELAAQRPKWQILLGAGASGASAAQKRYSELMEAPGGLEPACLLNLIEGMSKINLASGTVLDYIKQLKWDELAQDRIFGFCDPALVDQVRAAQVRGLFAPAPYAMHPGATSSVKQVEFGEANIQLTFHENDRTEIDGKTCVKIEVDIDYFRDPLSHLVLEVARNKATGNLTDPREVYVLRWMAGQFAGVPAFDPLYRLEAA